MRRLGLANLNNFMSLACSKVLTALYVGVGLRVIEYATLLILSTIHLRYDKVVSSPNFDLTHLGAEWINLTVYDLD